MNDETPLDADELMLFSNCIEQPPEAEAEWVSRLFQECLRALMHEAELISGLVQDDGGNMEAQLAQVAPDAAE